MITAWWASLSVLLKVLWGVTLASTFVFIIQSVMTFIGADSGDIDAGAADFDSGMDFDTDVSGDLSGHSADTGMNLYTFRNFINFCLGFGWTAVLFYDRIESAPTLFTLSIIVGLALVAMVMFIFRWLGTMQQSGNINLYRSAVGCHGTVYIPIPGERSGEGKVQISISGAIREYNAVTDDDAIPTGTPINVTEVLNANTLVVAKLDSLII